MATKLGFWGFVVSSALTWAIACGGEADDEAAAYGEVGDAGSAGSATEAGGGSAGAAEPAKEGGNSGAPTAAGSGGDAGAGGATETSTCGNGVRDSGEECDEASDNGVPGSYCDEDCTYFPDQCGDGEQQPWELCDDGNQNDNDRCSSYCLLGPCGDGVVQASEACDDGNENNHDLCRNTCRLPTCGDGILDESEECDDGNQNQNDDCLNTCVAPTCGDGIIHNQGMATELCDNGEDNGPFPAICSRNCDFGPSCGNGAAEDGKECDDGEDETGEPLNTLNSSCLPNCVWNSCGDGFAYIHETPDTDNPHELEECDDFNDDDSDPCTAECRWNVCGDGFLYTRGYSDDTSDYEYDSDYDGNPEDDNAAPIEECDDGNTEDGDGCAEDCRIELSF